MLDVILLFNKGNIILPQQRRCKEIYVCQKGADHPNACHVGKMLLDGGGAHFQSLSPKLFVNAPGAFQTGADVLNGIAVIPQGKLFIQHVKLGFDLHHGATVIRHQTGIAVKGVFQLTGIAKKLLLPCFFIAGQRDFHSQSCPLKIGK